MIISPDTMQPLGAVKWARSKLVLALACLFLSGALLALGGAAWYYHGIIGTINADRRAELAARDHQINVESTINRAMLRELANKTDANTDAIGRLLSIASQASTTSKEASTTAKQAAETAAGVAADVANVANQAGQIGPYDLPLTDSPISPIPEKRP